jgi:hypothetical protein
VRLPDFEDRAYFALHYLYPNASDSLQQQLVDSMTDRYAKLQYEAYRTGNAQVTNQLTTELHSQDIGRASGQATIHNIQPSTNAIEALGNTATRKVQRPLVNLPASSIDTARVPAIIMQGEASSVTQSKAPKTMIGENGMFPRISIYTSRAAQGL